MCLYFKFFTYTKRSGLNLVIAIAVSRAINIDFYYEQTTIGETTTSPIVLFNHLTKMGVYCFIMDSDIRIMDFIDCKR